METTQTTQEKQELDKGTHDRTHYCGSLRPTHMGVKATLKGDRKSVV